MNLRMRTWRDNLHSNELHGNCQSVSGMCIWLFAGDDDREGLLRIKNGVARGTNWVGPIIYMLPRGVACMLSLAHSREAIRQSIACVANRSCKRQARLRSDLTTLSNVIA